VYSYQTSDTAGGTTTESRTNINLLHNGEADRSTGYSTARIGFDYFPTDGLSLGAALGYFHVSASSTFEAGGVSSTTDGGSGDAFLFAPRIGYAFMFAASAGIWPRAGITYVTLSTDSNLSAHALALTLEAPLVLTPIPHVAFLIGPTLDLGLSGGTDNGGTTTSYKLTDIGLQAGLAIYP
jgi:hypothetical protein